MPPCPLSSFIAESLRDALHWVHYEPNDERLWGRVRQDASKFMAETFKRGMLAGATPDESFFVRCGRDTMTQADIDWGTLRIEVGFAPRKPAEFVIVRIQHMTAES